METSPPAPPHSFLDEDTVISRFRGRRDLLGELAVMFLEQGPDMLSEVREAVHRRDIRALQGAAHTLNGTAGTFGLTRCCQAARRVEALARSGELGRVEEAYSELETEFENLMRILAVFAAEAANQQKQPEATRTEP